MNELNHAMRTPRLDETGLGVLLLSASEDGAEGEGSGVSDPLVVVEARS